MADLTPRPWQFDIHTDRFLLLRAQAEQVADQVADLPPREWQFQIHTDKIYLLQELRHMKWQILPSRYMANLRFIHDRFILHEAQAEQVADQVADLPPWEMLN